MKRILLVLFASFVVVAGNWHFPLYLDNGVPFRNRISLDIENASSRDIVASSIQVSAKALGLVGCPESQIRVVEDDGHELLFAIRPKTPDKHLTDESSLYIPATVKAGSTSRIYVYWDNPMAWNLPKELEAWRISFQDSFEEGDGQVPPEWRSAFTGEFHVNERSDVARTGKRSLTTILKPGATPNWVQFSRGISVTPGTRYNVKIWVKGQEIKGGHGAGFYLHIGPRGNTGRDPINKWNNWGTFDWKLIEFDGVIPDDADYMNFGTVMHGTSGQAWFDDFEIKLEAPVNLKVNIGKPESLKPELATPTPQFPAWEVDKVEWPERLTFSIYNLEENSRSAVLCSLPVNLITHANFRQQDYKLFLDGKPAEVFAISGLLVFNVKEMMPMTRLLGTLYLAKDRQNQIANIKLKQASDILSDMEAENVGDVDIKSYEKLLYSASNLVQNPSFETDEHWGDVSQKTPEGKPITSLEEGGLFGKRQAVLNIPDGQWNGFRQQISVTQGRSYLFTGWINSSSTAGIWVHEFSKRGKGSSFNNMSVSSPGSGWRMFAMTIKATSLDSIIELHLTSNHGQRAYDGILLAEAFSLTSAKLESQADLQAKDEVRVQSIAPIIKVFQDTIPRDENAFQLALAKNESESLQLAVRTNRDFGANAPCTFSVTQPANAAGATLPKPDLGVVGFVKIDSESRYYEFSSIPVYAICVPEGQCPIMYPDPIIPTNAFNLKSRETTTLHIRFNAPKDAVPGKYGGFVTISNGNEILRKIPCEIQVWDFTLPDQPETTAIFDDRYGKGKELKTYTQMDGAEFLAKSRLSLDEIPAKPHFYMKDGKVNADFEAFDKTAKIWFEEWNIPIAYLPLFREHFGWGHLPKPFLGIKPYPGNYPHEGCDRAVLTPEYKKVCQEALKLMMSHIREKGWEDRFILYISDEPAFRNKDIIKQMIALCDMCHEAWPTVKIYSSTWCYVPEWLGKLDVWGIGVQGQVSVKELELIKNSGAELLITTDGQQCLDTPYNAIERLLPLYAWKYNALGYEFWGADWLTLNPFEWGIHKPHFQSGAPGKSQRIRYPNGDGYIFYPGNLIGHDGPVASVRTEALRDGIEDHSYIIILQKIAEKTRDKDATQLLEEVKKLLNIPNAGGRKSLQLLPNPMVLHNLRLQIGNTIHKHQ